MRELGGQRRVARAPAPYVLPVDVLVEPDVVREARALLPALPERVPASDLRRGAPGKNGPEGRRGVRLEERERARDMRVVCARQWRGEAADGGGREGRERGDEVAKARCVRGESEEERAGSVCLRQPGEV